MPVPAVPERDSEDKSGYRTRILFSASERRVWLLSDVAMSRLCG